jgi:hypothetical protein
MHTAEHAMAIEMQRCIDECLNCGQACIRTIERRFELRGKNVHARQIRMLSDCAAICQTTAGFMLRGSPFHAPLCAVCAEVCSECERECRSIDDGDEVTRQCADACRRTTEACERLANVAA